MKLEGITFLPAITLGPLCDDGRVEFTIERSAPMTVGPGVYLVFEGKKLVYIGSYQTGVVRRWVYLRKRDVYHFKKPLVAKCLKHYPKLALRVFAQDEVAIKEELGKHNNVWVNATGIEARLIAKFNPPWNSQGKKAIPRKPH